MVTGLITTVVYTIPVKFLNDKSLYEKETLEKVYHPEALPNAQDPEGSTYTWYCEHNEQETTIWANFHKADPNKELVEISVRRTCFYPEKKESIT